MELISGSKRKIDNRTKRVIVRRAAAQDMTASQICADLQLLGSVQRVRQILHEDPNQFGKSINQNQNLLLIKKLDYNLQKNTCLGKKSGIKFSLVMKKSSI